MLGALIILICSILYPNETPDRNLDFILIGDFGNLKTSIGLNTIGFDKINYYIGKRIEIDDRVNGLILLGDLLYPKEKGHPTEEEIHKMTDLFNDRRYLNQTPIYSVLGNHDHENPMSVYFEYPKLVDNWQSISADDRQFYFKEFEIP